MSKILSLNKCYKYIRIKNVNFGKIMELELYVQIRSKIAINDILRILYS